VEGIFKYAIFRIGKTYKLMGGLAENEDGDPLDSDDVTRARGVPRKEHRHLPDEIFTQDPAVNTAVIRSTTMRPSGAGYEMFMARESKTLSNTLNVYRTMLVSCVFLPSFHPRAEQIHKYLSLPPSGE
jgi:hypothetical protein